LTSWKKYGILGFTIVNQVLIGETKPMTAPNGRYFVSTLARGMQVLETFSQTSPQLSLTQIASRLDLDKSTAFRILYTLEHLGYLERDARTRLYRLGLKPVQIGLTALNSLDLVQTAQPYLKALFDKCGETTNMTMRDGREIFYVARHKTQQVLNVGLEVGSRLPAWCTSMGKAQLVDLSPEELRDLWADEAFPPAGPNALPDLAALRADLDMVRARGYALNDEELAVGVRSVAASVRDSSGRIVAAVNVSVPSVRVSRAELESRLAVMVVETAGKISQALGAVVVS
jgi:IclR family pca regulon transcriptional regulator